MTMEGACLVNVVLDGILIFLNIKFNIQLSDKWTMPSEYYTFIREHVQFFALDTNAIMWDPWLNTGGLQPD